MSSAEIKRRRYDRLMARITTKPSSAPAAYVSEFRHDGSRFLHHIALTKAKPLPTRKVSRGTTSLPVPPLADPFLTAQLSSVQERGAETLPRQDQGGAAVLPTPEEAALGVKEWHETPEAAMDAHLNHK